MKLAHDGIRPGLRGPHGEYSEPTPKISVSFGEATMAWLRAEASRKRCNIGTLIRDLVRRGRNAYEWKEDSL